MVWSPIIGVSAARGIGRCGGGRRRRRGGSARRRFARRGRRRSRAGADWFLDEFELVHGNGDIMLTHTEEAANTNNHGAHLAVLVQDQLIDIAELFVCLVIASRPMSLDARHLPLSIIFSEFAAGAVAAGAVRSAG